MPCIRQKNGQNWETEVTRRRGCESAVASHCPLGDDLSKSVRALRMDA